MCIAQEFVHEYGNAEVILVEHKEDKIYKLWIPEDMQNISQQRGIESVLMQKLRKSKWNKKQKHLVGIV